MVDFSSKYLLLGFVIGLFWIFAMPRISEVSATQFRGPTADNVMNTQLQDGTGNIYKYIPASCNPHQSGGNTFFVVE